jgi:hypothetical protein
MIEGFKKQRALTLLRLDRLGVEGESVVRAFMRGSDESDVCLPQADKVEAFCFGANLESPRAEKGKVSEALIAWLDERILRLWLWPVDPCLDGTTITSLSG